ncbi:MAG: DUF2333 family protein [Desulfovibrio sp.]
MTDTTKNNDKKKALGVSRKAFMSLLGVMIFWPAFFYLFLLSNSLYRVVDTTRFPMVDEQLAERLANVNAETATEKERGVLLLDSITIEMRREMDSMFGWSVNDAFFMPTKYLDNRNNRQMGVIFATRMLVNFYSTNMGKLGAADPENKYLKECRERRLVYGEDIWGFFRSSAESEFETALDLMTLYKKDLQAGKAIFNVRSDDLYNVLKYLTSETFLGQPLGLLIQPNEEVDYLELDDRIYYTQGAILVVRDFLSTLVAVYPDLMKKAGDDNLRTLFRSMERIAAYDPDLVLRGAKDSMMADHRGKLARYLITAMARIDNISEAIRR